MKLQWTEPALFDLESIKDYIAKDSPYYAAQFTNRIVEAVETLPNHPLIGRVVPEAEDDTIRELLFQNYRIIYRSEQDRIMVLTVIHSSRDLGRFEPKPWDVT
jgi:addiction module RelE/StbE family toxin